MRIILVYDWSVRIADYTRNKLDCQVIFCKPDERRNWESFAFANNRAGVVFASHVWNAAALAGPFLKTDNGI